MTPKILASSIGFHEFLFCPTEISVMKSKYSYLEQFYIILQKLPGKRAFD